MYSHDVSIDHDPLGAHVGFSFVLHGIKRATKYVNEWLEMRYVIMHETMPREYPRGRCFQGDPQKESEMLKDAFGACFTATKRGDMVKKKKRRRRRRHRRVAARSIARVSE